MKPLRFILLFIFAACTTSAPAEPVDPNRPTQPQRSVINNPKESPKENAVRGQISKTGNVNADSRPLVESPKVAADENPTTINDNASNLKITELVLSGAIESRKPSQIKSQYIAAKEQLIVFINAQNSAENDEEVDIILERPNGRETKAVSLHIPAKKKKWRTWSRHRSLKNVGKWKATVRTKDGHILAEKSFEVITS